jgi:2-amino-4-hydroxy-6-hydroxymethyldihydropteridine diphosphokinase
MKTAYLGLGSNVDAKRHIRIAVHALIRKFGDVEFSPIYESKAVGFEGGNFINLVARIQTTLKPLELRQFLRTLEESHGRDRKAPKWSNRTLDIDILLFDDLVIETEKLQLPRGEILHFAHVLKPLADIAGDLIHPLKNMNYRELWQRGDWQDAGLIQLEPDFLDSGLRLVVNHPENGPEN